MFDYNKLVVLLNDSVEHYKELLAFEHLKLSYIINDDIDELSKSLSKEQALIMQGNSLEKKRIDTLLSNNMQGETLESIIKNSPDEFRTSLQNSQKMLQKYVGEVKRINSHALEIVTTKLSEIQQIRGEADTYDVNGGKKHNANNTTTLEKSV